MAADRIDGDPLGVGDVVGDGEIGEEGEEIITPALIDFLVS